MPLAQAAKKYLQNFFIAVAFCHFSGIFLVFAVLSFCGIFTIEAFCLNTRIYQY
jgi:hypothetical protein